MLFKKGTKLYSIFNNKCPKCNEGDFFVKPNSFRLRKVLAMHETCSHCNLKYMIEPSFFYGAMYVSYALTVALFVTMWASFNLFFENVSVGLQIFLIISATVLLTPYLYALSKIIWANFFIKYDRERSTNQSS